MRKIVLSLAAATALAGASAANAAITIGATSGADISVGTPDNVTIPNKVNFDSVTNISTTLNPWFEFSNDMTGSYIFDLTSSTAGSTITLEQLLTGGGVSIIQTVTGSSRFLELDTGILAANTTYRFLYTYNTPAGGGTVSGNASFYAGGVPEPATWAMMLIGFGGIGLAMRRRRRPLLSQVA